MFIEYFLWSRANATRKPQPFQKVLLTQKKLSKRFLSGSERTKRTRFGAQNVMERGWKAGGRGDGDGQLMEEWEEVSGGRGQHARAEHLMCVSL